MKKKLCIVCSLLALAVLCCSFTFTAFAETGETGSSATHNFTSGDMKRELSDFVGGVSGKDRMDRTSFSAGEAAAAQYLSQVMGGLTAWETQSNPFTYQPYSAKPEELYASQNIVSVYKSPASGGKAVILGANYDNQYGDFKTSSHTVLTATASSGAYMNGTGVATLLQLARAIDEQRPALDFDVYVVFFGAGEMGHFGAEKFVESYMSAALLENTLLMVNLQRIGGDHTYIYSDEVKTDHNEYLFSKVNELGLDFSRVPTTLPLMPADYLEGMQYVHMGMIGANKAFADRNVPYANIFGGTFDTLQLGLDDTKGQKSVIYTENDNVQYLNDKLSSYSYKMAETAELLFASLVSPDFVSAVENTKQNVYDYDWLMHPWIASVIMIGIILLSGLALVLVVKHLEKKYPYKPTVKRLKIAVFGMEYEEKNDSDIFLDIKPNAHSNDRNPFDGY